MTETLRLGPETRDAETARHWARVHREVADLRRYLLDHLSCLMEDVGDPAVRRGLEENARWLRLAMERSRRLAEQWEGRLAASTAPGAYV